MKRAALRIPVWRPSKVSAAACLGPVLTRSLPFSPRESSKSVSSGATAGHWGCPPVPRSVCEQIENGRSRALIGATARSSARKVPLLHGTWRRGCVKRQPVDVLLTEKSGSPLDTDLERISLRGPRIKDLGAVVRDREWCPDAITNSPCVNRVRVSSAVNTTEISAPTVLAGTRGYRTPRPGALPCRASARGTCGRACASGRVGLLFR